VDATPPEIAPGGIYVQLAVRMEVRCYAYQPRPEQFTPGLEYRVVRLRREELERDVTGGAFLSTPAMADREPAELTQNDSGGVPGGDGNGESDAPTRMPPGISEVRSHAGGGLQHDKTPSSNVPLTSRLTRARR
jgi:hypothetical protein